MERLLTESEAAEVLGVMPTFLREKRRVGGGPRYIRISHRVVRYAPEALRAWLEERSHAATDEEWDEWPHGAEGAP